MHYESVGIPVPPPPKGYPQKILREPPEKSEVAPGGLKSVITARFHCVFIMLVQCILYTKFGLFHRSKAYGSYLWVPDALLPIDFSMYLTKQNPIFLIG